MSWFKKKDLPVLDPKNVQLISNLFETVSDARSNQERASSNQEVPQNTASFSERLFTLEKRIKKNRSQLEQLCLIVDLYANSLIQINTNTVNHEQVLHKLLRSSLLHLTNNQLSERLLEDGLANESNIANGIRLLFIQNPFKKGDASDLRELTTIDYFLAYKAQSAIQEPSTNEYISPKEKKVLQAYLRKCFFYEKYQLFLKTYFENNPKGVLKACNILPFEHKLMSALRGKPLSDVSTELTFSPKDRLRHEKMYDLLYYLHKDATSLSIRNTDLNKTESLITIVVNLIYGLSDHKSEHDKMLYQTLHYYLRCAVHQNYNSSKRKNYLQQLNQANGTCVSLKEGVLAQMMIGLNSRLKFDPQEFKALLLECALLDKAIEVCCKFPEFENHFIEIKSDGQLVYDPNPTGARAQRVTQKNDKLEIVQALVYFALADHERIGTVNRPFFIEGDDLPKSKHIRHQNHDFREQLMHVIPMEMVQNFLSLITKDTGPQLVYHHVPNTDFFDQRLVHTYDPSKMSAIVEDYKQKLQISDDPKTNAIAKLVANFKKQFQNELKKYGISTGLWMEYHNQICAHLKEQLTSQKLELNLDDLQGVTVCYLSKTIALIQDSEVRSWSESPDNQYSKTNFLEKMKDLFQERSNSLPISNTDNRLPATVPVALRVRQPVGVRF